MKNKVVLFPLADQLERNTTSVVLNLSEGHQRRTVGNMANFLGISLGSLQESISALDLLSHRLPDQRDRIQQFISDGEALLDDLNALRGMFTDRGQEVA